MSICFMTNKTTLIFVKPNMQIVDKVFVLLEALFVSFHKTVSHDFFNETNTITVAT